MVQNTAGNLINNLLGIVRSEYNWENKQFSMLIRGEHY